MKNARVLSLNISLISISLISPLCSASARMTGEKVYDGGPASVCRLYMTDSRGNTRYVCSAVVIAKNRVISAAHCFNGVESGKEKNVKLMCNYDAKSRGFLKVHEIDKILVSSRFGSESTYDDIHSSDFAQIELASDVEMADFPTVADQRFIDELSSRPNEFECKVSGYGLNERGSGELRSVPVENLVFDRGNGVTNTQSFRDLSGLQKKQCDVFYDWLSMEKGVAMGEFGWRSLLGLASWLKAHFQLLGGDSGGPLLCRKSSHSSWVVIGVTSNTRPFKVDTGYDLVQRWALPFGHKLKQIYSAAETQ